MNKKFWANLLLIVTTICCTYVLLEAGYRLFLFYQSSHKKFEVRYSDQPLVRFDLQSGYRFQPNLNVLVKAYGPDNKLILTIRERINNNGHVSHYDDQVDKAPGEFRIAVIGDSFTDCTNTNWPDVLHDLLNQDEPLKARLKVSNFSVLNFGRSGIGLQQFAAIYDHEVAAYHPDLVLVNFITDDIYRKFLWISPLDLGKIGVTLISPSLPAKLENPDCTVLRGVVSDRASIENKAQRQQIREQLAGEIARRQPWFSPHPELLAQLIGRWVGLEPRLTLNKSELGRYDSPDTAIDVGARALQGIAAQQPHTVILFNPAPLGRDLREVWAGRVPPDVRELEKRLAPLAIVKMASFMKQHQDRQEIARWFIYDGHFNDYGAKIYAQAVHKYLTEHWAGTYTAQKH